LSNLVNHARRELELVGEDEVTIEGYLGVIQAFADMGHSGGSAMVAIPVITELLSFKNLTPLTDDPEEWMHIAEEMWGEKEGVYQNRRNSEAFSYDKGRTYYLLSEGGNDGSREPLHVSVAHTPKVYEVPTEAPLSYQDDVADEQPDPIG